MDGKELQKKLKELGITQARVAEILGITPQTVSGMMRNASIKVGMLERIAEGIGKDISVFLDNEFSENEKYQAVIQAKDEKIKELEATIQRLIGIIEKLQ